MPDKFNFNELGETVACIDCDTKGKVYEWDQKRREIHFLSHNFVLQGEEPVMNGETRSDVCRVCSREFSQERKRGRPRVLCYVCKPT